MSAIFKILVITFTALLTYKFATLVNQQTSFKGDAKVYFMQPPKLGYNLTNQSLLDKSIHKILILKKSEQIKHHQVNYNSVLFKLFWQKLTMLPEHKAVKVWFFISILSQIVGLILLLQAFRLNIYYFIIPGIILALYNPVYITYLKSGQVGSLITLLTGALCYLYSNNKNRIFAACLGFAIYFKYFLAGLLPILLKRYNLMLITILSFLLFMLIPLNFIENQQLTLHFSFFNQEISIVTFILKTLNTISSGLLGGITRAWLPNFGPQELPIYYILLAYCLLSILLFYKCLPYLNLLKQNKTHIEKLKTIAILFTLAAILNPLSWAYYFSLYLPSILLILYTIESRKNNKLWMLCFIIIITLKLHIHSNLNLSKKLAEDILFYSMTSFKNFWICYNQLLANFSILYMTLTAPTITANKQIKKSTKYFYMIVLLMPLLSIKTLKLTSYT